MKDLLQKLVDVDINQPLTYERIFTTFTVTFFMGLLILLIYRLTYKGVLFNRTFGTSLLMVAMVTSLVIMPISSNVVLSLGMVGALSIVRFRTALKDPLDIVYMFWAIALGLTAGAGFFELAIIGCVLLAIIMVAVTAISQFGLKRPYLLVIRYSPMFRGEFSQFIPPYKVKSKTVTPQAIELVVELTLKSQDSRFLDRLQQMDGILSASLVRYSGDF